MSQHLARLVLEIIELLAGLDVLDGLAVLLDDAEHGFDVVFGQRLGHVRAAGVLIARERAHDARRFRPIARRRGRS